MSAYCEDCREIKEVKPYGQCERCADHYENLEYDDNGFLPGEF